jgi:hypothetical protein
MKIPENAADSYAEWVMSLHNPTAQVAVLFEMLSERQKMYAYAEMLDDTARSLDEFTEDEDLN